MNEQNLAYSALIQLGQFLRAFFETADNKTSTPKKEAQKWNQALQDAISLAQHKNGWFTKENVDFALRSWGDLLKEQQLSNWLSHYNFKPNKAKTIGLIMAGNIPLVGFHDLICVLLSGHKAILKLSSQDTALILFIRSYILHNEPLLKDYIVVANDRMKDFDAIIATGSNNTSRYFEYYFKKVPRIIRRNRNSVAVLTGNETTQQLEALGNDIFQYYGLGCRSVSKIFVPREFHLETLFKALYPYHPIINHKKYENNYDYNKAVYLMSEFKILDNGFLILKEDQSYASPIASLFYEYYDDAAALKQRLRSDADQLQCVVSSKFIADELAFGTTQNPKLSDYADGVDTLAFLTSEELMR